MSVQAQSSDVEQLHRMGYAQELRRRMSGFSNFAVSFTIISILSGCLTLYGYGMNTGGPIIMNIGWPLVGLFVNLLRVPYPILYPVILVCSILGVYAVNSSVVDVWIMLATGVLGYLLRKLDFETAPIVLGLVLAPMMELSLRQSLAMSGGNYTVFVTRPISVTLLAVGAVLVVLALRPLISRTLDWRSRLPAESEG